MWGGPWPGLAPTMVPGTEVQLPPLLADKGGVAERGPPELASSTEWGWRSPRPGMSEVARWCDLA
jgi:hypothetical protein